MGGKVSPLGVAVGFLPKDNKNTFNIVISTAEASTIEDTDRLVREIGRLLARHPAVTNYQSWVGQAGVVDFNAMIQGTAGRQGENVAEIRVNLTDKRHRSASSIEIVRVLRPEIEAIRVRYPGAPARLVEDPPGPPVRASILAELHRTDPDGLRRLSAQIERAFADTYDMVDISNSELEAVPGRRITPDREKAALSGVSVAEIADLLRLVYAGQMVGRAHVGGELNPVGIHAYVPRALQPDPAELEGLFVTTADGRRMALADLVRVVPATADRTIQRKDNEPVVFVGGELSNSVPLFAVLDLNRRLSGIDGPAGRPLRIGNLGLNATAPDTIDSYQLLWDGEMRMTLDIYRDMMTALSGRAR